MLRTRCTNQVILTGFVGEKVEHRKVKGDISKAIFYLGIPYEEGDQTEWETRKRFQSFNSRRVETVALDRRERATSSSSIYCGRAG